MRSSLGKLGEEFHRGSSRLRKRQPRSQPPRNTLLLAAWGCLCWVLVLLASRTSHAFGFVPAAFSRQRRSLYDAPAPSFSYRGYPDEFDGRRKRNGGGGDDNGDDDEDPMRWWEQAIRRASSSPSSSTGGGGMVQPVGVDGVPLERNPMESQSRIRSGFDKLFAGMPSVNDILSGGSGKDDDDEDEEDGDDREGFGSRSASARSSSPRRGKSRRRPGSSGDPDEESYAWFEEERSQIMEGYEDIMEDMMRQLAEQRKIDPDKVPESAEALMKSVLKEEMEREIAETRERRARERLDAYARDRAAVEAARDLSGPPDPSLQKLIDESEEEYARREASRAELEDFLLYEKEAFQRAAGKTDPIQPQRGADLDRWALERLKEMAKTREGSEESLPVLDILEENVKSLQQRLEKQKQKRAIQPDTMKEWQMYRSIATKLLGSASSGDSKEDGEPDKERELRILAQLESWKDYVEKEATIRSRSGLARGPKLPFEWQESSLAWDQSTTVPDKRSRAEVRKEINRMSIEALESLSETSDPSRKENLLREIDLLKSALEGRDYLDVEEDEILAKPAGPVDLSDVFPRGDKGDTAGESRSEGTRPLTAPPSTPFFAGQEKPSQSPPGTPSFPEEETVKRSIPPKTPFFSDFDGDKSESSVSDSKLGSMEEQKLNAMFRRTGVRSKEEQDVIRRQWEDFKQTEQEKRTRAGLSSRDDGDDLETFTNLKYNITEVMRDDGDFDADKVLATIGPRPKRSKRATPKRDVQDPSDASSVDEADVRDSLYRAVSAIGGGRYKDDPEMQAKQQASFEEFLEKEEEMRRNLDEVEERAVVEIGAIESNSTFDDEGYAEEVLSSLGPRPKPKRTKILDEGEYSDKGGVLASEDEDDESIGVDVEAREAPADLWGALPEWLRKEREREQKRDGGGSRGRFLGSDIDEVFDDDYYDHNMRQLHEYEQRRAGRQRTMGIDISDVLGRRAYETDDYADYKFDDESFRDRSGSGWGAVSFAARKRDLLQYTELDLTELNRLMDHKDSVYATGVSQYLPRINKPFKVFGAIFRLEGVLVDTTGLQFKAWSEVAKMFEFREPTLEDVQRAAVIRPESAVREVFYWADDVLESRKAAIAHRDCLRKAFDEWRGAVGIEAPSKSSPRREFVEMGQEIVEDNSTLPSNSSGGVGSSSTAWTVIANAFGKSIPKEEDCWHAASLSPEEAIVAFGWTDDPAEVLEIAESHRQFVRSGTVGDNSTSASDEPQARLSPGNASGGVLDETAVAECHYFAWRKVAERFQYESPDPEAAMAAFVVNDPELTIREGFGWTADPKAVDEAANSFAECLEDLLRQRLGGKLPESGPLASLKTTPKATEVAPPLKATEPTPDELLDVRMQAWSTAARAHGFPLPTADIAKLTTGVDAGDAVRRLLKWTEDPQLATQVADSYNRRYDELMRPLMARYKLKFEPTVSTAAPVSPARGGPTDDDIFRLAVDSWSAVASKRGLSAPDSDQVMFAMTVGPEEAILTGFQWTDDREEAKSILEAYKTEVGIRRQRWSGGLATSAASAGSGGSDQSPPAVSVAPDVSKWVKSLMDVEMQCAVVSFLERDQVDVLLEYAGLADLFGPDRRVSATDGYGRESQQLLGAALRVERRPDHCVVFDCSPQSSDAAHEDQMQSVCFVGPYPRYELLAADSTAASFSELTAMNVRRLFGERVYDQPQLETQAAAPAIKKKPKVQTRFWDDDS